MFDLESKIYTKIKYSFSDQIKKKYPDLEFTTSDNVSTKPKFPTVYIHMLPSPEIGQDLEGLLINGTYANFQIKVTHNKKYNIAREVMNEVVRILKTMRFSIQEMPYSEFKDDAFSVLVRARRTIGAGEINQL